MNYPKKMKESAPPLKKKQVIQVISEEAMTADQQSIFTKAIDALLAELVRKLDCRNRGNAHESTEK